MSRFLFTMWDGGGTTPPELGLARRLVAAGHEVHVLGDPVLEHPARSTGADWSGWDRAPHRAESTDPEIVGDWRSSNPLGALRLLRDRLLIGPAEEFAADTAAAIQDLCPDAVLVDSLLLGPMIAVQGAGLPLGVVMPNIWTIPTPGIPAFGPGFTPARGPMGRLRDRLVSALTDRLFTPHLSTFNRVRSAHGLEPLTSLWDQVRTADRLLVLTSPAFDPASAATPDHVVFTGPLLDEPSWVEPWTSPFADDDERPLVLVGLSSTYQEQEELLRRIVGALAERPVRGVVTTGPMIDPVSIVSPDPDVVVVRSAPHRELLAEAAVVVTHAGHGTTMKALSAGVPLVCVPMGRDQNDTAARVVHAGAGRRISPGASARRIGREIDTVLGDPSYSRAAERLSEAIAAEIATNDIVAECERLVAAPAAPASS